MSLTRNTLFLLLTLISSKDGVQAMDEEQPEVVLHGEGASFPNIIYRSWMKAYVVARKTQTEDPKTIEMTYSPFSSLRGKEYMIQKNVDIDFGGSDSALTEKQYQDNPSLQMIPTMAGPIVIGFRLPNITKLRIGRECLVGIYNGTVKTWNDTLLQQDNRGVDLPPVDIEVVARRESSGTTEVMTSTLASFSPEWKKTYGVFSEKTGWKPNANIKFAFRHYGMVDVLEKDYTLAYLPLDVADTYKVSIAQLQNSRLEYVGPTSTGVKNAMHSAWKHRTKRLTARLPDADGTATYPMASFTYIIINFRDMTCQKAQELARFVHWIYNDPSADEKDGFISVTDDIGLTVQNEIFSKWTCTSGDGQQLHVKTLLDEQFDREKPPAPWIVPVAISVPLFVLLVIFFAIYLAYQRYKINKMMNQTDWDIEIEEIAFYPPKSFKEAANGQNQNLDKKQRNIRASFMSGKYSVSTSDSLEVPVSQVLHWPGKWKSRTIGLRILQVPNLDNIDKDIQRTLVWMRDSVLHENVVHFYGLTTLDNERFIISDYCHKGSLSDILRDSKLNMNENLKLSISFDVATGMTFLHSLGIVHGLLRSASCVIDSRWTVKVADWEYYKLHIKEQNSRAESSKTEFKFETSTDQGKQLKNSYYFAPEILRANSAVEPSVSSDVYSYAILVQEIFTRKEPYFEISDILSPKEIVEAIKVNSIRPVHCDLTPLKIKQIMEIAWADDSHSRPSFDQVMKMLKNAHPGRKSVLDHMIDVMDEYSHTLEAKVEEKSKELDLTKKQFNDLLLTFLPPYATQQLMDGQTVMPVNLTKAALMIFKITGFGNDATEVDAGESGRLMAEVINLLDEKSSAHDMVKVARDHDLMIFIGNLDDNANVTKATVAMATMIIDLVPALKEWSEMSKWTVGLRVALHIGQAKILVLDTKVPMLTVIGEGLEELKWLYGKGRDNSVLVSSDVYRVLVLERYQLTRSDDREIETYWLTLPDNKTSDAENQSESSSSTKRSQNANSPTLRASLRRWKQLRTPALLMPRSKSPRNSRSSKNRSGSRSRSRHKSRSNSPEMEVQQTTHLLLSEPSSPETETKNVKTETETNKIQNGGVPRMNKTDIKPDDEQTELWRKREEILQRHRRLAGGAIGRPPSPEEEEGVPGLAEIFIMC